MLVTITRTIRDLDPDLAMHSSRVARIACDLGEYFGIKDARISHLRTAAMLHDVGKLHVPARIVYKPAPLTPGEWVYMRQHPEIGFDIVADRVEPEVAEAVLTHHERYDGHGYPHRRREGETPLIARILQVADAFDAITSDRCYQPSRPFDFAMNEIEVNAKSQFDPLVVGAMMSLALDTLWVDSLPLLELAFSAA